MDNIFNDDFTDFIKALNSQNVKYILVGGYAVIYHGHNRTTGDLDLWIEPTKENYILLEKAFNVFGMPVFDMTLDNFLSKKYDVFTFGKQPVSIYILTDLKGDLNFQDCFDFSKMVDFDGLQVRVIDIRDLISSKKQSGRFKDLDDLEKLDKEN